MTLRDCEYGSCRQPAERDIGNCAICSLHLCAEHSQISFHNCPSQVRYCYADIYQVFNFAEPSYRTQSQMLITKRMIALKRDISGLAFIKSTLLPFFPWLAIFVMVFLVPFLRLWRMAKDALIMKPFQARLVDKIATSISDSKMELSGWPESGLMTLSSRQNPRKSTSSSARFSRWRMDMLPGVLLLNNDAGFFLKHFDDKGDHLLVDEDFNLTGVIDWEFTSAEPKAHAFSSPCMLWPVRDFYDGKNDLSPEETEFANIFERRGRQDMAHLVRDGRKMQRYQFYNGGGVSRNQDEFEALFQGLRASWAAEHDQLEPFQDWKDEALHMYAGDEQLDLLRRSHSS
jgi:hypothetical protein